MASKEQRQTVFVVRHGERVDYVDPDWVRRSPRSYDPPLTKEGVEQAKKAGKNLRGKDIETVISSPFIRCLQTAQQICDGLDLPGMTTCNGIVDVLNYHFGMYEPPIVPADNVTEQGIKVISFHQEPLPKYPEKFEDALKRYNTEINRVADEHWPKNIVIVTHFFGVKQAVALTKKEQFDHDSWADYCGYVEMSRTSKDDHDWTGHSTVGIEH